MLFRPAARFRGLPPEAFDAFAIPDREERRRAIVEGFHPELKRLGEDLLEILGPLTKAPLHAHLPRLDWPQGYRPFCTWLAISHEGQGYQSGPQLNLGVHADHVAIRLGWDPAADGFGRFEFQCRHGGLGASLGEIASGRGFRFRVYASAPWPEGSRRVFESGSDWAGSFEEVRRRGVWWEVGLRLDLPDHGPRIHSPSLGGEAAGVFAALLPCVDRVVGVGGEESPTV